MSRPTLSTSDRPNILMSQESLPTFSLVIPVYNEEEIIAATVEHLHQILQPNYEYEIIGVMFDQRNVSDRG
ncbi:MAG: hypothetical protein AAFR62_12385 [Cyanobacteria bacterium J06629_2]